MTLSAAPTAVAGPAVAAHGGLLVDRTGARPDGLDLLESVTLTPRELSDLDMLACGALSPLQGFMGRDDYWRVLDEMRLSSGLPWTLPVCLAIDAMPRGNRVALADTSGRKLAVLDVHEVYDYDVGYEAARCFGTTRATHPGVARLYAQKPRYLAGPITVFDRPQPRFPDLAWDPSETRRAFAARGWSTVAGFQTRNPIHRGHEYLTKVALETLDGLLIHPLLGETKADDVDAATRVECYRTLVANYYPVDRVVAAAFPAAMRYAGPREAVWHAICRKNYGCTHFIVGRDHAGVGGYYGTFDSQTIFAAFEPGELGIEPICFEHLYWCRSCGSIASRKTCPHGADVHVSLSGTKVRGFLQNGQAPPAELIRPEIARILIRAYRSRRLAGDAEARAAEVGTG